MHLYFFRRYASYVILRYRKLNMNYTSEQEVASIIVRSLTDEITDSERAALDEWMAASPDNAALYWKIASGASLREYRATCVRADMSAGRRRISARVRRRSTWRIAALTGAAAAVVAAFLVLYNPTAERSNAQMGEPDGLFVEQSTHATLSYGDNKVTLSENEQEDGWKRYVEKNDAQAEEDLVQSVRIDIPLGGCYKLVLDDGTVAWLNSGSSLEYPRTFGSGARIVELRGEGYFEVADDETRPFEVALPEGLAVKVLGTKFNVSAYDNLDYTTVTLAEGAVELMSLDGIEKLTPNRQALFDRETGTITTREVADAMAHAAWIHGVFDFKAEPLNEVMDALGQWYGMTIVYEDGIDISTLGHFTMKVGRSEDFRMILERLRKVTGFNYQVTGNMVRILQ